MRTWRKSFLVLTAMILVLSMLPMIPVSATEVPPSKWDGTASMDWITAEAAQGEDTNSTAYNGSYYKVKNYEAGTTFVIDSAADLAGLAGLVNVEEHDSAHWFKNCTFYITENIDLNSAEHNWEPIGFFNKCGFSGTLVGSLDKADGTGGQITISNMKIVNSTAQTSWGGRNAGLVGTQTAGGIKNIVIDNANVTSSGSIGVFVGYVKNTASTYENLGATNSSVTGSVMNVGGLFGYINVATTTVTNCSFEGTVESSMSGTEAYLGGIVGRTAAKTIIDGCSFSGTLTKSGEATQIRIGGISGRNSVADSEIKNCNVTVTMSGAGYQMGGIIGSCTGGTMTISNCHVKTGSSIAGTQSASPDDNAATGGIVGIATQPITVSGCSFDGTIDNTTKKTGGIVGYTDSTPAITNCTVKGSITSTHAADGLVAGIIGHAGKAITVSGCAVDCNISNEGIGRTGGIVAYAAAGITVNTCSVNGSVTSDDAGSNRGGVGGVIGYDNGNVTITDTYVGAVVSSVYAGGFIGRTRDGAAHTYTLTNCHFDGAVAAADKTGGAFVGAVMAHKDVVTVVLTNCLNTGVALSNITGTPTSAWIGLARKTNSGFGSLTFTKCYSGSVTEYVGACETGTAKWTVFVDGERTLEKTADKADVLTGYGTKVLTLDALKTGGTALEGFDFTDVWTVREGKIPTLKSAVANVKDTYANADLRWLSAKELAGGSKTFNIKSTNALLGLFKLSEVIEHGTGYTVKLYNGVTKPDSGIDQTWIDAMTLAADQAPADPVGYEKVDVSELPETQKPTYSTRPNTDNKVETDEDEVSETGDTEAVAETETAVEEKRGCGSALGVSALVITAAAILPSLAKRKKKEN